MNNLDAALDGSRAETTVQRVREALAQGETACVAKVLEVLQEMAQKADDLSIQDLAAILGRDLTTVTKVMKAAHCLGYNPAGIEVNTLSEAIAVIGFDKIRNLVLSLLLMETAEARTGAAEAQDVAALALTSALTAQALCARTASVNPDQAFVCAALRQYGKLLLSTFLPEDYRAALALAQEDAPEAGFRSVFGLTTFELSQRILAEANVSKLIANSLDPVRPQLLQSNNLSEADRLLVASDFANQVCAILGRAESSAEQCQGSLAQLVKSRARSLALVEEDLQSILETVDRMLGNFGRAQGVESFSSPLLSRLRLLAQGGSWKATAVSGHPAAPRPTSVDGPAGAAASEPIQAALREVKAMVSAPNRDARAIFSLAARAIRAGLRLRSCLVFLPSPGDPRLSAMIGSGALFEAVRNEPLLDPRLRDVFTVCLERGEDAVIQNPSDPKIAAFIPSWFRGASGAGPLVLLPVRDREGTFAVICGVVSPGERVELPASRLQQLKALRTHLALLRGDLLTRRAAA